MNRIVALLALLFAATPAFAADRYLVNPDSGGNLKMRVNKAGTITDVLTASGSDGAVVIGPSAGFSANYNTVEGSLIDFSSGGATGQGVVGGGTGMRVTANIWHDNVSDVAHAVQTSQGASELTVSATTTSTNTVLNLTADTTSQTAGVSLTGTQNSVFSVAANGTTTIGGSTTLGQTHLLFSDLSMRAGSANNTRIFFRPNALGTDEAILGAAGATNGIITGTAAGDFGFRERAGNFLWSTNDGTNSIMRLESSTGDSILDLVAYGTNRNAQTSYKNSNGIFGYYGVTGSANAIVLDAADGDVVIRSTSKAIRFSHNGSTSDMVIDSTGLATIGPTGTDLGHLINGSLTVKTNNNNDGALFIQTNDAGNDTAITVGDTSGGNIARVAPNTATWYADTGVTGGFRISGANPTAVLWTLGTSGGMQAGGSTTTGTHVLQAATTTNAAVTIADTNTTTTSDSTAALLVSKGSTTTTGTTQVFARFYNNNGGTLQGSITSNGSAAITFTNASDVRLKENIETLPSQLANILSLRPVEFDWKNGSGHQVGFIAQEMQEVYPDAVGKIDGDYLGIAGWSKTDARLVKAIQEQQAQIAALTARLAALEAAHP